MSAAPQMRSQVNWAVLGLLLERPSYGYELHQRMARRFPAELLDPHRSHVYAALNVMLKAGFIEPIPPDEVAETAEAASASERRQPKVHYRVTAEGGRAFRTWLAEQLRSDPAHDDLVRRIALAAGMRRVGLIHDLVSIYEDACAGEAQTLPMPGVDGLPARSPEVLVRRLTVAARRMALEGQMAWLRYARREIEAYERGQGATD